MAEISFEFATAGKIIFGSGASKNLPKLVQQYSRRVFLVKSIHFNTELFEDELEQAGIEVFPFQVPSEPDIPLVHMALAAARMNQIGAVVAIGGGSVLDTGKAVAALMTNLGEILDYLEVVGKGLPLKNRPLPMIAVPTTAGTGSEVTRNAVLAVPEKKVKVSLRSPLMLPGIALVDPQLTLSLPAAITASTGMDALTQVLEPFVSIRANPMTDLFCREGMVRIGRSIRQAYAHGEDLAARTDMAWGSLLGGLALANAGLGAAHGFAAPIGGQFSAPHGAVCARLLPFVVAANVRALQKRQPEQSALARYEEAAELITGMTSISADEFAGWLLELCTDLDIPALKAYGISAKDSENLVEEAKNASSMKGNPIRLLDSELGEILTQAIG